MSQGITFTRTEESSSQRKQFHFPTKKVLVGGGITLGILAAATVVALAIIYRADVSQFFGSAKHVFETQVQPFFTHTLKNFFEKQFVPFFKNTIPTTAKNVGQFLSAHKAASIAVGVIGGAVTIGSVTAAILAGRKYHHHRKVQARQAIGNQGEAVFQD